MLDKYTIQIIVVAIVAGVLGFFIGRGSITGNILPDSSSGNPDYQTLLKQVERAKEFFPPTPGLLAISGEVTSIHADSFIVAADPSPNPFEEWPTKRTVNVNAETMIVKRTAKDADVLGKEIAAYEKSLATAGDDTYPLYPESYIDTDISLKDIPTGERVTAEASENIKDSVNFTAVRVIWEKMDEENI